jgi:hypothetical protein
MKSSIAALMLFAAFIVPAHAVKPTALIGTWEAARSPDDERMFVRFLEKGKAEIIAEYDFQVPGTPGKRRGRSTTFGKWSVKGDDVSLTYAKVHDRLRYSEKLSLAEVGLDGVTAGLQPIGRIDSHSRIRATLWKAPHGYKMRAGNIGAPGERPASPAADTK